MVHQVAGHRSRLLDIDSERQKLEQEAKKLTKEVLQDWANIQEDDIKVSEISGGITNLLWLLTPDEKHKTEPVVLRVFGKQTDKIIDRNKEAKVLPALNAAGFGAQVLATFENGRIEAYLPMRPLKPQEMVTKKMARRIARRLRQFHTIDGIDTSSKPELFETILKWLKEAKTLSFEDDEAKAKAHRGIEFDNWIKEFQEVREIIMDAEPSSTFTHNDLLAGNVLVPNEDKRLDEGPRYSPHNLLRDCGVYKEEEGQDREEGDVQFIDFEYSDTTYRAFDMANHFCEYAGFECDYSRFPDQSHVEYFVREYLKADAKVDTEEIKRTSAECFLFALISHQYWGTWAILQAKYSLIDFDYMGYGKLRWAEYHKRKHEFIGKAKAMR